MTFPLELLRLDYLLITVYCAIFFYLIFTRKKTLFYHFLISSAVATLWTWIGQNEYGYNHPFLTIAELNVFPLFAWAIGLFFTYLLYLFVKNWLEKHFRPGKTAPPEKTVSTKKTILTKISTFPRKIALFLAIYWPLLIAGETIGYHFFNIHNLATATYPGLPICNCLHAAPWMQFAYFTMGPIFFILTSVIPDKFPLPKSKPPC